MKLIKGFLFLLILVFAIPALAQAPAPKHVILVIQENRTPDNLFQDQILVLHGADLLKPYPLATSPNAGCSKATGGLTYLYPYPNLDACFNPNHDYGPAPTQMNPGGGFEGAYDSAKWDGACTVPVMYDPATCIPPTPYANYTYVQGPDNRPGGILEPYFQIAENYSFSNYMFETNQGPSFDAHQFLFSGTSAPAVSPKAGFPWFASENAVNGGLDYHYAGCVSDPGTTVEDIKSGDSGAPIFPLEKNYFQPPYRNANAGYPCYDHPSLADLLDAPPKVTWKYYIQSPQEDNSIWTAPNALNAICPFDPVADNLGVCNSPGYVGNGDWTKVDDNLGDILSDIQNCNLPQVSWVVPDGQWSDHPGTIGSDGGPSWVAAIVNAVGATKNCGGSQAGLASFDNTTILITWDDWGGWYDHVAPYLPSGLTYPNEGYYYPNNPAFSPDGNWYAYGFRVPLLVVSAYTPAGYVSGANLSKNPPYVHDFGSILGYIEWAFGLSPYNSPQSGCGIAGAIDPINGCDYPFADYFALDGQYECSGGACGSSWGGYPLSDFFTLGTPRSFTPITGAKYPPSCFQPANVNNSNCFPGYPSDPDNEDSSD